MSVRRSIEPARKSRMLSQQFHGPLLALALSLERSNANSAISRRSQPRVSPLSKLAPALLAPHRPHQSVPWLNRDIVCTLTLARHCTDSQSPAVALVWLVLSNLVSRFNPWSTTPNGSVGNAVSFAPLASEYAQ